MKNKKTPNLNAQYIYTPKGDGDLDGVPIKVDYWRKVPGKPTYEINLQEILDTFGGDQFKQIQG